MLSSDLIYGAKAAADYCGLPRRVIYHLVEKGELPAIKKGKALFFRKSELERAFTANAKAA